MCNVVGDWFDDSCYSCDGQSDDSSGPATVTERDWKPMVESTVQPHASDGNFGCHITGRGADSPVPLLFALSNDVDGRATT